MNESISTAAGAQHGQLMRPKELRQLIRAAGRIPIQRSTTYRTLKVFVDENEDPDSSLDSIDSSQFGSYHELIDDESWILVFIYKYLQSPNVRRALYGYLCLRLLLVAEEGFFWSHQLAMLCTSAV